MTYPNRGGYQPARTDSPDSPPAGGSYGTTSAQAAVNAVHDPRRPLACLICISQGDNPKMSDLKERCRPLSRVETQDAVNAATHGAAPPATAPKSGSIAGGILTEAANIVGGARNATHGDKERSFQVIADLWNAYLNGRKVGGPLTPFDVAQFMVLLKVGRSISGTPIRDHFVDAAGYSGIAGELVEGKSNV